MTVGGARAHFGSVRRQPRDFEARGQSRFGQYFAKQQHALAAETRDFDAASVRRSAAVLVAGGWWLPGRALR